MITQPDMQTLQMSGPLRGLRVLELGGIGPGPFGAMLLADLGADVIMLERAELPRFAPGYKPEDDVLRRGRASVVADLKSERGRALARRLAAAADVLIDPFRPGVTERLGLGPVDTIDENPRLVYARVTGWGQEGPWKQAAGHDINYLALAGPLAAIGQAVAPPPPPLNLVADFGGGGMLLALGIVSALLERAHSGCGQVIDAAMVDGAALQFAMIVGLQQMGIWNKQRESNLLDGGAPFYRTYATSDAGYVAVGALEPQFYAELLHRLDLDAAEWPQSDRLRWPALAAELSDIFITRTRLEWEQHFAGSDACVTPVLTVEEAAAHKQNAARSVYQEIGGLLQPAPAPRFNRTPCFVRTRPPAPGEGGDAALRRWGLSEEDLDELTGAPEPRTERTR